MAVESGKVGRILYGSSEIAEVRNWKFSASGGTKTYATSTTSGCQRTVDGTGSGTLSFSVVLDPASAIESVLDVGSLVTLLLYRSSGEHLSVPCRISAIGDDVNIEEGEPPSIELEADTHGAWTLNRGGSRTFVLASAQDFTTPRRTLGTSDFAVCMWVYPTELSGGYYRNGNSTIGVTMYCTSGGTVVVPYGTGSGRTNTLSGAGVISVNTWHFLVLNVVRAGTLKLYINGTERISADISGAQAVDYGQGENPWYIGYDGYNQTYMRGRISMVGQVIGNVFTESERTQLYNGGRGLVYSQLPAGLLSRFSGQDYWDMTAISGNEANRASASRPATQVNNPGWATGPGS